MHTVCRVSLAVNWLARLLDAELLHGNTIHTSSLGEIHHALGPVGRRLEDFLFCSTSCHHCESNPVMFLMPSLYTSQQELAQSPFVPASGASKTALCVSEPWVRILSPFPFHLNTPTMWYIVINILGSI